MNRTMICCTILITIVSLSIGQERRDIIYLKNGDVIKGIIVENVFNDYVRIELAGGSILSYKYVDIEKIIKEQANQPQMPSQNTWPVLNRNARLALLPPRGSAIARALVCGVPDLLTRRGVPPLVLRSCPARWPRRLC